MKGGGQQQQSSPELAFFLILTMIVLAAIGVWYYHSEKIIAFFFNFRFQELKVIYYVVDGASDLANQIGIPLPEPSVLERHMIKLLNADPNDLTFNDFYNAMNVTGMYMAYPGVVVAACLSVYLGFFKSFSKYRNIYTMKTFSNFEAQNWPMISPVLDLDLVREDIDKGPWRMTETPILFAERHKMVESIYRDGQHIAKLNREKAYAIIATQLGPLWTGLEGLPGYVRALFAIFSAKAENDNKGARALLDQISRSSRTGKLNFAGTQDLLIKHVRSPKIGRAVGPHAYLLTVMASMLELARTDGVLASAEFLWLKPLDRNLWYMLNCVGRQTPFPEISGPFAHWIVEKRLRRPLKVPMVAEAVDALDVALSDIIYNPEEDY